MLAAGAALVGIPLSAHALDLTPDASRFLSDPNYLPMMGQVYGYTGYDHTWTNGDTFNSLGADVSSFHVNADTISQFLSYGVTDDLDINAAIRYAPGTQREIDRANGARTFLDSSGFSDPSFGADWRALDQSTFPVDVDIFGSYTPDLGNSDAASATNDGTVARGGQSGAVGAALGYGTRDFSLRGAFNANIYGNSQTLDLGTGDVSEAQGYTDYVLSLATQTRLDSLFSVNAGVDRTFATNHGGFNTITGASHLVQPGDMTALRLALNYTLAPDHAVLSATYAHEFFDNSQTLVDNPADDTSVHDKSGNIVGVQLYYALP
jgi:hypothetical protein